MEHRLILLSADLKQVHARLARRFNAPLVEQEQSLTRNEQDTVRGCDGAPDDTENRSA
jgi:hypothetical protein